MLEPLELELAKAADVLVRELLRLKAGESLLITFDSESDWRAPIATARAAQAVDAKVALLWHTAPPGYGKTADPYLPDSLKAAIPNCDVWVEFNYEWLLYSTPWEEAIATNRVRYLCLVGMDAPMMVRCIGKVNWPALKAFQDKITEMTQKARRMRVTTPAGTDVSFENGPDRPVLSEVGYADTPGAHFLGGQIGWAPVEETINGTIVFDGSFSGGGEANLGVLKEPIKLIVEKGRIVKVEGGREAKFVESWLASFNDPNMYNMAHICYGFNPGAKLTGVCLEDERVWGCTEWGIGYQGPMMKGKAGPAATHADGICLNSSVWLDDVQIMEEGRVIHPELVKLAKALGKA
ncbi:leucyl aminopeptidase [Candidatus Bathyarchaeota archaeon]|nr:leucyl aminopeptidase [Candidatus Bathyarchaeota archaeon]